jgi:microcystin-dependent protein
MNSSKMTLGVIFTSAALMTATPGFAQTGDEPFLGEIANFGFNFCPRGWASTSGQILSIAQNTALFSLLGTTYGGNGQTTFALPDLRGRNAIGQGNGPGLAPQTLGQVGGVENITLNSTQMPTHNHALTIRATDAVGTVGAGVRNTLAASTIARFYSGATPGNFMDSTTIEIRPTGGNQPFSLAPPYLTTQYCIAIAGIFPSRN